MHTHAQMRARRTCGHGCCFAGCILRNFGQSFLERLDDHGFECFVCDDKLLRARPSAESPCAAGVRQRSIDRVPSADKRKETSRYRGVTRDGKRWRVRIFNDGEDEWVGSFDSELAAAKAYDARARELGRTKLNFGDNADEAESHHVGATAAGADRETAVGPLRNRLMKCDDAGRDKDCVEMEVASGVSSISEDDDEDDDDASDELCMLDEHESASSRLLIVMSKRSGIKHAIRVYADKSCIPNAGLGLFARYLGEVRQLDQRCCDNGTAESLLLGWSDECACATVLRAPVGSGLVTIGSLVVATSGKALRCPDDVAVFNRFCEQPPHAESVQLSVLCAAEDKLHVMRTHARARMHAGTPTRVRAQPRKHRYLLTMRRVESRAGCGSVCTGHTRHRSSRATSFSTSRTSSSNRRLDYYIFGLLYFWIIIFTLFLQRVAPNPSSNVHVWRTHIRVGQEPEVWCFADGLCSYGLYSYGLYSYGL